MPTAAATLDAFARSRTDRFANAALTLANVLYEKKGAHRLCDASIGPRCSTP